MRDELLAQLRQGEGRADWVLQRDLRVADEMTVSLAGPEGGAPAAVVRRASGGRSLWPQARALLALRRVSQLAPLVPQVIASGFADGRPYLVESFVSGTPLGELLAAGDAPDTLDAAARAVAPLHTGTSRVDRIDEPLLGALIDVPVTRLRAAAIRRSRLSNAPMLLHELQRDARMSLVDRPATTCWVHGDLSPGNLLIADGAVSGIVDWDQARTRGLAVVDLLVLLIGARMLVERQDCGRVVAQLRARPAWQARERELGAAIMQHAERLPIGALVFVAWLHHVTAEIAKLPASETSRRWVARNIDPVLAAG